MNSMVVYAPESPSRSVRSPSVPPLNPGEYNALLPLTNGKLWMNIAKDDIDERVRFKGFKRMPNGERGKAEVSRRVRNAGDVIVAIDGRSVIGMPFHKVISILADRQQDNKYVCIRFLEMEKQISGMNAGASGKRHTQNLVATSSHSPPKRNKQGIGSSPGLSKMQSTDDTEEYDALLPVVDKRIGIKIDEIDGAIRFTQYVSNGPAERGKLIRNVGDKILAVDGVNIAGKPYKEVLLMIKQIANTSDKLCIRFSSRKKAPSVSAESVTAATQKKETGQANATGTTVNIAFSMSTVPCKTTTVATQNDYSDNHLCSQEDETDNIFNGEREVIVYDHTSEDRHDPEAFMQHTERSIVSMHNPSYVAFEEEKKEEVEREREECIACDKKILDIIKESICSEDVTSVSNSLRILADLLQSQETGKVWYKDTSQFIRAFRHAAPIALYRVMIKYPNEKEIQRNTLRSFVTLTLLEGAGVCEELILHGIDFLCFSAMQRFDSSPDLQISACHLTANLIQAHSISYYMVKNDCINHVLEAMSRHQDDVLQQMCCYTFRQVIRWSNEDELYMIKMLFDSGAIKAMIDSMLANEFNPMIQSDGSFVLQKIAEFGDIKFIGSIETYKGVDALRMALQNHQENAEVYEAASDAISAISLCLGITQTIK